MLSTDTAVFVFLMLSVRKLKYGNMQWFLPGHSLSLHQVYTDLLTSFCSLTTPPGSLCTVRLGTHILLFQGLFIKQEGRILRSESPCITLANNLLRADVSVTSRKWQSHRLPRRLSSLVGRPHSQSNWLPFTSLCNITSYCVSHTFGVLFFFLFK